MKKTTNYHAAQHWAEEEVAAPVPPEGRAALREAK